MTKSKPILAVLIVAAVAAALLLWLRQPAPPVSRADHTDAELVRHGRTIYSQYCAACHGVDLEGETADWRTPKASGALPAPPHDDSGHTWHHPDWQLFEMTKYGMERFAPPGWVSDMPAFEGILSDDDIWAVLAYIKSHWSEQALEFQRRREAAERGR